jgi:predicted membrane channel-forming protein YqfA (hemolysin III family)
MKLPTGRPARHRITALIWRLAAAVLFAMILWGEPVGLSAKFFAFFACMLIAVLHDLVAATLQKKTTWFRALRAGDREIIEGGGE